MNYQNFNQNPIQNNRFVFKNSEIPKGSDIMGEAIQKALNNKDFKKSIHKAADEYTRQAKLQAENMRRTSYLKKKQEKYKELTATVDQSLKNLHDKALKAIESSSNPNEMAQNLLKHLLGTTTFNQKRSEEIVTALQFKLIDKGLLKGLREADGIFGKRTAAALKKYTSQINGKKEVKKSYEELLSKAIEASNDGDLSNPVIKKVLNEMNSKPALKAKALDLHKKAKTALDKANTFYEGKITAEEFTKLSDQANTYMKELIKVMQEQQRQNTDNNLT